MLRVMIIIYHSFLNQVSTTKLSGLFEYFIGVSSVIRRTEICQVQVVDA